MPGFLTAVQVDQIPAAGNVEQQAAWVASVGGTTCLKICCFFKPFIFRACNKPFRKTKQTDLTGLEGLGMLTVKNICIIRYLCALFGNPLGSFPFSIKNKM